jgi:hypothetical protein
MHLAHALAGKLGLAVSYFPIFARWSSFADSGLLFNYGPCAPTAS